MTSARPLARVRVRSARPDELPFVGALTVRAYAALDDFNPEADDYAAVLADAADRARTCEVLVAVDGAPGRILGAVTYVPGLGPYAEFSESDWAGVRMLAVAPEAWGRGIGAALMRACLANAERDGRRGVALHTTATMPAAARLYPRLGFRRAPERDWTTSSGTLLLGYEWRNVDRVEDSPGAGADGASTADVRATAHAEALHITCVSGDAPEVVALVDDLVGELEMRYGGSDAVRSDSGGSDGTGDPFRPIDVGEGGRVLLARLDGDAVGTATLRRRSAAEVEVKRMMVAASARGRGVGGALLRAAESTAREMGYRRIVLETGTRQPEAIHLYRKAGFRPIAPYGWYRDQPLSRCFAKEL